MRNSELDWLKCVCIILMVLFHLVYIEHTYPDAKALVYLFHMPVFLMLSGYLLNVHKPWSGFGLTIAALALPYVVMETAYYGMATVLPIAEHVKNPSVTDYLRRIFVAPLGPYWYLHSIIAFSTAYYAALRLPLREEMCCVVALLLLIALSFAGFSLLHILCFFCGTALRAERQPFSLVGTSPFIVCCTLVFAVALYFQDEMPMLRSFAVTTAAIIVLQYSYRLLNRQPWAAGILRCATYIGRHTLAILLFSPIFTGASHLVEGRLTAIDPTGILFAVIVVPTTIAGSLAAEWVMRRLGIQRLLFLR